MKSKVDMILEAQKDEITEHYVYLKLAGRSEGENRGVLIGIADDELRHYQILKEYSGRDVSPSRLKIWLYSLLAMVFGLTFAIKLMERGEKSAQNAYSILMGKYPRIATIYREEELHEEKLADMIEEEKISYIGSMVLGLNDALVELTGALAGLTFTLPKPLLIGVAGLITGVAASISMASSEYMSRKSEGEEKPGKAAFYTGIAYIITVILLVSPYFVAESPLTALSATLTVSIIIIAAFSFFVSVVKDRDMKKMFLEMLTVSLGVATVSFIIGLIARTILHI